MTLFLMIDKGLSLILSFLCYFWPWNKDKMITELALCTKLPPTQTKYSCFRCRPTISWNLSPPAQSSHLLRCLSKIFWTPSESWSHFCLDHRSWRGTNKNLQLFDLSLASSLVLFYDCLISIMTLCFLGYFKLLLNGWPDPELIQEKSEVGCWLMVESFRPLSLHNPSK